MFSKTKRSLFIVFLVNASFFLVTPVLLANTIHSVCQTPSVTIPDNNSTGISDILTISDSGQITDINVIIDANHGHLGELIFSLEHEGSTVTLLETPGQSATVPKGCYGQNIVNLTVDDEATHSIQNECHSYDPGYEKTFSYYPKDSLTAFDNQNIAGDWTLTVTDNYDFNSKEGTLNKWCIKYERVSEAGFTSIPDPGTTLVFNDQPIVDERQVAYYSFDISESANIEDLIIYSADISGIHADDFQLIDPDSSLFPFTIPLGTTQTFKIACQPTEGGERTAIFTLKTNVTNFTTITYPLSCTGLAANYSTTLTGSKFNVGETEVNTAVSDHFEIQETAGLRDLILISATITGNSSHKKDFEIVNPVSFPHTIAKGNTTPFQFEVKCTPSVGGKRQANLVLTTNDLLEQTINYKLECTGLAPVYKSEPVAPNQTFVLGNSQPGNAITRNLDIKNRGTTDLEISLSEFTGDLSIFSISLSANLKILPWKTESISVECDPLAEMLYTATLQLSSNDPSWPTVDYPITCQGSNESLPLYDSTPFPGKTLSFGSQLVGATLDKTFEIRELGNDTLKVSLDTPEFTGHADDFSVLTAFPIEIADGGTSQIITVQCHPTKGGLRTAILNLTSNDDSNSKIAYTLKCRGKAAAYSSTPLFPGDTLNFGEMPVGQTVSETFEIQEMGEAKLILDLATIPISGGVYAKDFEIISPTFPISIADNSGDQIAVTVQCRPSNIGEETAQLNLISNDPLNPTPSYSLKCTGKERVGPGYVSTPLPNDQNGEAIDFGSTPVGVGVSQTFEIREVGTSVLDVGLDKPNYFTGTHADDFSVKLPEPDTFDINSFFIRDGDPSQTISLECKPSEEGLRKAILHLISSDQLNPKPSYELECTGTPPSGYSSAPAPDSQLDFGNAQVGTVATQQIEIQEVGEAELTVDFGSLTGDSDFTIVSPSSTITIADGGAAQIVRLQCQPSSVGKKTAQLKLTSNDPNNATLLYDLECTGTSATSPTPPPSTPPPSTPSSPIENVSSTKTLIVELAGKGKGRVKSEPLGIDCDSDDQKCYSAYEITTRVTLIAEVEKGSVFDHWEGCPDGRILMISHHSCVAYFELLETTLTVKTVGKGQVSSDPVGIDCNNSRESCRHTYEGGPTVTLTARPDAGWQFEGWTGQCDDTGRVTLLSNKQCQATFVEKSDQPPVVPLDSQVNLAVAIAGKGKGRIKSQPAGIDCGLDCIADYDLNTLVLLSATPVDNSIFSHWEGDCSGTSSLININLEQAKSCDAYFALPSVTPTLFHTLTVEKIGQGRVMSTSQEIDCGDICSASYSHNTELSLLATPETGFEFTGFSGDCQVDGHLILDTNQYCIATFVPIPTKNAGRLQFSQTEVIVNEEITQLVVTVTRIGGSEGAVSVDYVSNDDTALQGTDYTAVSGTLEWEEGEYANKTFMLVIQDDSEKEETESLGVSLNNVKGGATLGLSTLDVIIYDNDKRVPSPIVNYTLSVTKTGTGSGSVNTLNTGIRCGDECTHVYPSERKVILIVQAETGSRFIGWEGDCHGNTSPFSITLTADRFCEAIFDWVPTTSSPTAESPVPETSTTPSLPDQSSGSDSCLVIGNRVDAVICNLKGKEFENLTIGPDASLSNIVLKGTINNQGWISNATMLPNSHLTGGILTGYITNDNSTLIDIEFRGALLKGGTLAGQIINNSPVGGSLQDVNLAKGTEITGGIVAGNINGDTMDPGYLNNLTVTSGSCLSDVIIGEDVELPEDVKYGPGVKLIADPDFTPDIIFICKPVQANGEAFKNVVIEPEGELADALLGGKIENKGEASDITLQPDSELTGGKLTGKIANQGTLIDIHLQDAKVTGGTLGGDIENDGIIQDVSLEPNTTIRGGELQASIIGIIGDVGQLARLESLSIDSGSQLENLIVGQEVSLSKEVTLKNVTIDKQGKVSRALLEGTIDNQGRIANPILQKDSHLMGGILSGDIANHGTIEDAKCYGTVSGGTLAGTVKNGKTTIIKDVILAPNAHIIQGHLQGRIEGDPEQPAQLDKVTLDAKAQVSNVILDGKNVNNEGTIVDAEFRGLLMTGGTLSGNIKNTMGGTIKDVYLAPNTTISGGNLQGDIIGDRRGPALLENVFIPAGTYLENVLIGDNVTLSKNVIEGSGVTYKNKKPVDTELEEPSIVLTALRFEPSGRIQGEAEADFVIEIRSHGKVLPNHAMLSYFESEWLQLSSTIQVVPDEVSLAGELLVVAKHEDDTREAFSMRDGKKWLVWDKDVNSLEAAELYPQLPKLLDNVLIYEGDLTDIAPEITFMSNGHLLSFLDTAGEYTFTVGYRLKDGSIVFNGLEPIHFFVERAPTSCILYALHDGGLNNSQGILIDLSAGLQGNMEALGPTRKGRDMEGMALDPSDSDFLLASAGDDAKVKNEITGKFEELDGYLYRIHRETGDMEIIGPTEFEAVSGLAFNPVNKTLWGWGRNEQKSKWSGIIQIDPISGMGTAIKQFDYHQHDMGALAWSYDGSLLYTASDEHLWVYDPETQELEIACDHVEDGKIEGLDLQPNGFLLVGVDRKGKNHRETSILAYDPVNCNIVHKRVYEGMKYDDIESIVWPASECNDMSWLSDQESELSDQ